MLHTISYKIWGHFEKNEFKKFLLCSFIFMLVVGSYWILRIFKDAMFDDLVGIAHQPKAKILSLVISIPLIFLYAKLVDSTPRHSLFFWICSIYACIFGTIVYFYEIPHAFFYTSLLPGNLLGWITYISIESFGAFTITLFWSFMASTTTTQSAKKGYSLIYAIGQIGTIGATTLTTYVDSIGFLKLWTVNIFIIISIPFLITLLLHNTPEKLMISDSHANEEYACQTGLFQGIRLLIKHPYLIGIFVISTFYELVATIMQFQMKMLAKQMYPTRESFTAFLGMYGQSTNILALLFALFGTGFMVRSYGVRFCLVVFPLLSGSLVFFTFIHPTLWIVFITAMLTKGLSYTLNNPVKELMYIPTSKDIKFKTKNLIEAFGTRSAEGSSSLLNNLLSHNLSVLITYGTLTSLGIIGIWATVAFLVGTKYNQLIKNNTIIE